MSPSPQWRSGRVIAEVDYAKETPSMVKFRKAPPKYKFPAILTAKHRISQSLSPDIPQQLAWDILDAVQRDVT
ncbi:MAG: hypothetical protein Q8P67_04790, partial [archaeon]|nr:hypothetical protein [archaeon]